MTPAAQRYFELYYKIQRCIDENAPQAKSDKLRQDINECYNNMTEKEKQLIDIVGIEHDKI
jgi:FixJ family two-component response regulator